MATASEVTFGIAVDIGIKHLSSYFNKGCKVIIPVP